MDDIAMMREALALAQAAADDGEVPVGCVIVRGGEIVGRGRNRREEKQSTASHAEMEAIAMANDVTGSWRSLRQSARHAGRSAAGGFGSVRSM